MAYINKQHKSRLVIIDVAQDIFSTIYTSKTPNTVKTAVAGSNPVVAIYEAKQQIGDELDHHLFNMPFLFNADGLPWWEANSYLFHLVKHKNPFERPTDQARRCASRLLQYKLFCEKNGVDWLDFSGKRPSQRPTYKYFQHLYSDHEKTSEVVNQHTGVVFDFYKHVAKYWHEIDIDRVDTIKKIKLLVPGHTGAVRLVEVDQRSQTLRTPEPASTPIGYVKDDGENLRPLTNTELSEFVDIVKEWSVIERLILYTSLFTGARKQSVLTMRLKHLNAFTDENLNRNDGTYTLHAGPRTGIDTKFDKPQQLFFPRGLAKDLKIYAHSKLAQDRREKFQLKYAETFPNLQKISHDDMYLFLSDQGNCYYMAEDDPRYPIVKAPPTGQIADTLKRKLLEHASDRFPKDFRYHWLRATYAYQYYLWLQPHVNEGRINPSEQISMVQRRLHHRSRETTESYLKLFNNINEKMAGQAAFEEALFGDFELNLKCPN